MATFTTARKTQVLLAAVVIFGLSKPGPSVATAQQDGEEAERVHALFNLSTRDGSPFPSDLFTVADANQNTGRRISLPYPDCGVQPSDCQDLNVINGLDGFGLQTRISIPFDAPIDPGSVNSGNLFLLALESYLPNQDPPGQVIGINQIVWDPDTNTLHVESDAVLEQARRYAVIVTDGIVDSVGVKVKPTKEFRHLRTEISGWYRALLLDAIAAAERIGVAEQHIVAASVYSTQTITSVMERVRDGIKGSTPTPATFTLGPSGERAVFNLGDVASVTSRRQNAASPVAFAAPVNLDLAFLRYLPGIVGTLAFGEYASPEFIVHPGEHIPQVPTRTGTYPVQRLATMAFDLVLPSGTKPPSGWPVAIIGHGSGSGRHEITWRVAAKLAQHGIASIGVNGYGFGFGPESTITVTRTDSTTMTIRERGRSIDQNGDNTINNGEGSVAAAPASNWTIGERDGYRQTAADLLQLVRVIESGMDVDGDGSSDIDAGRIYAFGNSAGERYSAILTALDPTVRAVVLGVSGGMSPEHGRWAISRRPGLGRMLAARVPSLINLPGVTSIDGVPVATPFFNENKPLRDQPAVINTVAGAMAIQNAFEMHEWGQQSAQTSQTWIRHLESKPLAGVPSKPVLVIFGKGDQNAVNPGTSALLRAGNLLWNNIHYRHDLAYAADPTVPKNPHDVLISPTSTSATFRIVSRALQDAIGNFLASDGQLITQPEPAQFFEVPIAGALPESLNYIQ
jgi:Big-like domain-containing protein